MNTLPILQVEDEEHDVLFLQIALETAGITNPVHVARDGREAIAYLSKAGEFSDPQQFRLPCLILLDLKLPRCGGLEVLRWLRQESGLPCLTVIVFSSSGRQEEIEMAYRLGANSYVVKPSGLQERADFAKCLKDYWLRFHAPPQMTRVDRGSGANPPGSAL